MGYCVLKSRNGWRVLWEHWEGGKRTKRHVKREELPSLGLAECKNIEEARDVVRHLNAKSRVLVEEKRRNKIAERRRRENLVECAHLPTLYVDEFRKQVVLAKGLREPHWEAAKRAIRAINRPPADWYFFPQDFYNYFTLKARSPDYSNRIIRALNEWGRFFCRKTNTFWQDIPKPRGKFLNQIRAAYEKRTAGGRYRARLSLDLLQSKKNQLAREEFGWLLIAVAFGLRPEEINKSLRQSGKWGVRDDALFVYQYKLERVEPNPKKRWKRIDINLPHQREAMKVIMSGEFRPPTRKKLKDVFGPKMTYYGGRKEFFPAMRKSYDAYTVSKWMGHSTLETAMRHYDDPEDDFFVPPQAVAARR